MYACAQDCLQEISLAIKEKDLNRVVVASCTPRTHEPLFRNACREGGLNQYLCNMANIRDQCSWIHMHEPERATEKSNDLLRMAVAKAMLLEPLVGTKIPVTSGVAVIGGGITGMSAALDVAAQGFPVHLVERGAELGGSYLKYVGTKYAVDGVILGEFVKDMVKKVESNKLITVHKKTMVKDIPGFVGNFKLQINSGEYQVGAVILAVGASEYKPTEFNYGKDAKVITLTESELAVGTGKFKGKDIAFIQCVGSRNDKVKYCSRTCCANALTNAIAIKKADPKANITMFHKDVRTYGFREELYNEASALGVRFLRCKDGNDLPAYDGSNVKAFDTILGKDVEIPVDRVILSCGVAPDREEKEELAKMLKVPISKDGFYFEAHQKLRPVDFATEGVFVAGLAHWPKFMDESIAQAAGAAARALTIISKDNLISEGIVASVFDDYCDGCGICVGCCDYNAIEIVDDGQGGIKSYVNPGLCKGCGCCVASCPSGAMEQKGFKNVQIQAEIDACFDFKAGV
jgi:heterodisulfide reductase subunit A